MFNYYYWVDRIYFEIHSVKAAIALTHKWNNDEFVGGCIHFKYVRIISENNSTKSTWNSDVDIGHSCPGWFHAHRIVIRTRARNENFYFWTKLDE